MVGKTYLKYVPGPQGGAVISKEALTLAAMSAPQSQISAAAVRGGRNSRHPSRMQSDTVFLPSLEAVRVFSVKSSKLLHTLIPAQLKLPAEVSVLRLSPLGGRRGGEDGGWFLSVGYSNGHVAAFSCSQSNNYGKPMCQFYSLGHSIHTKVLSLATGEGEGNAHHHTLLCSGGQDTDITVWDLTSHEPLYRLRGHRGGVVGMELRGDGEGHSGRGVGRQVLVSAGADGWVKVWDLQLRLCLQTVVVSEAQVTSLWMDPVGSRLYCAVREAEIKVYNLEALTRIVRGEAEEEEETASAALERAVVPHGSIARRIPKPITSISASADGQYMMACSSHALEVFRVHTKEDVRRKVQRKNQRRKHRTGSTHTAGEEGEEGVTAGDPSRLGERGNEEEKEGGEGDAALQRTAAEEVSLLRTFFFNEERILSAVFLPSLHGEGQLHIAVGFRNNDVKTFTTALATTDRDGAERSTLQDLVPKTSFSTLSHPSDIRQLCFVDTDTALLSMSREKIIKWVISIRDESEMGMTNSAYADRQEANLSVVEEEKGRLVVVGQLALQDATAMDAIHSSLCCVGQADGSLLLVDVTGAVVLFTEANAHVGGVKSVTKSPTGSGFLTLGADRRLLLWNLAMEDNGLVTSSTATSGKQEKNKKPEAADSSVRQPQQPMLMLAHEVELTESPLFVVASPDEKYIGVGLQNHQIQLFFADSLKPYLSLFGHKLPPSDLSFSTDGALVASVGLDKSLRFWGLDFGDCHRAIHAHDDYVTSVRFLKDTHYVFTGSMDGSVKQWDGDHFVMVQFFRQFHRGVWGVAVTMNSTCVVAGGVDGCIRTFLRTGEVLYPEEEEERIAHEAMEEEMMVTDAKRRLNSVNEEVGVAGHSTASTAEAAEKIMSALDLVSVELQREQNKDEVSTRHPLLGTKTVWEYLWSVLQSIRPSDLRHALNGLTSLHVDALLDGLLGMLEAGAVTNYEMAARVLLGLVTPSPGMGVASLRIAIAGEPGSGGAGDVKGAQRLEKLRLLISRGLDRVAFQVDYNVVGLEAVQRCLEETERIRFFDVSQVQGHRKRYHSQLLTSSEGSA